jgi:hypothetical protein
MVSAIPPHVQFAKPRPGKCRSRTKPEFNPLGLFCGPGFYSVQSRRCTQVTGTVDRVLSCMECDKYSLSGCYHDRRPRINVRLHCSHTIIDGPITFPTDRYLYTEAQMSRFCNTWQHWRSRSQVSQCGLWPPYQ